MINNNNLTQLKQASKALLILWLLAIFKQEKIFM